MTGIFDFQFKNFRIPPNYSPLHRIAFDYNISLLLNVLQQGNPAILQYLSASEDLNGYTPLHLVVECTDHELGFQMAVALVRAGADPHKVNGLGNNLLHIASTFGNMKIARFFVEECEINVNVINNAGNSPITLAAEKGHLDLAKYYLEKNADMYLIGQVISAKYPLTQAATWGQLEVVEYLLSIGFQVDIEVPNKRATALLVAVERGHEKVVEALLGHGANPNKPMEGEFHPLFLAAMNGHVNIVRILVRAGAEVNATNSAQHIKAIDIARTKGHVDIVNELSA